MGKKLRTFSVGIDRNCSEEIIVKAKGPRDAEKKAWRIFANRKPKRKHHHVDADEIYGG